MRMILKEAATACLVALCMTTVCCQQRPAPSAERQHRPAAIPTPSAAKKDGPNFNEQRLIALFGSEAQPVYGNRDPTTGQVILDATHSDPGLSRSRHNPVPGVRSSAATVGVKEEEANTSIELDETEDQVDRKDTRIPETNEINPFKLLPPQFHDLLNIPIHDYGNGTTYNPYDKYKVPSKNKYPLVSTGYANTKYQGSPSTTTTRPTKPVPPVKSVGQVDGYDYDYDSEDYAPIKPSRRPTTKPKTSSVTTTKTLLTTEDERSSYQDQFTQRPTATKHRNHPSTSHIPLETDGFVYRPRPQEENVRKPQARPTNHDDFKSQFSSGTRLREPATTYRPEDRPSHTPEHRPEYRPDARPIGKPDNWPDRKPVSRPSYDTEDPSDEHQDEWPVHQEDNKFSKPFGQPSFEDFMTYQAENRPKQTHGDQSADQPTRPNYSIVAEANERPSKFTTHQGYRPSLGEQVTEIKVTPKPFYAADENQNFNVQPQLKNPGQVDSVPDIIYDYDDERGKGEGVLFMFDSGSSDVAPGPEGPSTPAFPNRPASVSSSPLASPYPTVASRDPRPQHTFNPAFRPSSPVRPTSESNFVPAPSPTHGGAAWNVPLQQKQQPNNDSPRPPFRFPSDPLPPSTKENQPPNILPLFRPNTNPTDEFKFIKHPQQIEIQRQQAQQPLHGQTNQRPTGQETPLRQRPGGISPLPSALQSPFSSISQAVANFFGRRSGQALGSQRTGNLDATEKMDRSGNIDQSEMESDLDMAESSNSFVLFSRPDQPSPSVPVSIDRSGLSAQQQPPNPNPNPTAAHPQVVGIRATPDATGSKPPAFYVYTSRELEQGKPPYLVVGPVLSGPPNVAGAQLVHTAPAQPIVPPESQRRSDFPSDGSSRPNLLSFPAGVPQEESPTVRQPDIVPIRKPFFPITSGNSNKIDRLPTALSPPRQGPPHLHQPLGFVFPENSQEMDTVLPQGISPASQGIPPPRVPLNPQKDVASLFSNPTLLHNRPHEGVSLETVQHQATEQKFPVKNGDSSEGVASVINVPLYEATSTLRPPKRKTTKSPTRTTTPAYMDAFNNKPVTYATIQQEDGKQIAVVHPAYIVTYKSHPGPPELIDLDAPFVPSIESPSKEGELSSIPFEKWHVRHQEIERKGEEEFKEHSLDENSSIGHALAAGDQPEFHGGFVPLIPGKN